MKSDDQYDGLSSTFAAACRKADQEYVRKNGARPVLPDIPLISEHGVPSATTLQAEYLRAIARRNKRGLPRSVEEIAEHLYFRNEDDPARVERFSRWLLEHTRQEQAAILKHIEAVKARRAARK